MVVHASTESSTAPPAIRFSRDGELFHTPIGASYSRFDFRRNAKVEEMKDFEQLNLEACDTDKLWEACFDWPTSDSSFTKQMQGEFLNHYHKQLGQLDLQYGTAGEKWVFAEKSHRQISEVIEAFRYVGVAVTRAQARRSIRDHFQLITPEPQDLDALIDAALRTWLLVNFRCPDFISIGGGRPCVSWRDNETLSSTLETTFGRSTTQLTLAGRRLSPAFTISNMHGMCGLHVKWASTLDDHLRLDRQNKILWIFPLRHWLRLQSRAQTLRKASAPNQGPPTRIPPAPLNLSIYEEANRTLDLLFPSWDQKTRQFLKKHQKEEITAYAQLRELDLKHYDIWRDRLLELNEDVFLAPPEGWVQLWNDRRDPQKFWTFWIALVILWLTIVSTVATVLQTWATLTSS